MKILSVPKPAPAGARRTRRAQAFTVAEMMVAVFIFVFMVLGIIYTWMFGMRFDQVVCSKLGASDKSRMSFDLLTGDIRSAKSWGVGNIVTNNKTSFTRCVNATNQVGNALSLTNSMNINSWIRYWFNTNTCQLCRGTNDGVATRYQIIAQNLTNSGTLGNGLTNTSMTFQGQKYDGTLAQDWQFKYMLVTTMEFCQYQYPLTKVGPGYYYNYYRIQLKAASHCPN